MVFKPKSGQKSRFFRPRKMAKNRKKGSKNTLKKGPKMSFLMVFKPKRGPKTRFLGHFDGPQAKL